MNPVQITFRQAQLQDVPAIVALVNSAYRGESGKRGWTTESDFLDGQRTDGEEVARLLDAEGSMILLGEMDGELVASVHLERHEEEAYLGMLAVRPGWQNLGVGKAVMAAAEERAAAWGAAKMLMTVITLRHELIAFYGRRGYARTGRVRPFPASEKFGVQKVPGLLLEYLEKPLGRAE